MEWYYEKNGSQHGPISEDALKALIAAGDLVVSNLVWREGMGDWVAYASVFPEETSFGAPQRAISDASCSGLRREAREALSGNWWSGVLVTFVYGLLQQVAVAVPFLGVFVSWAIAGPLQLGYHGFFQGVIRRESVEVGTLFKGFERWGQGFALFFVTTMIIVFASIFAAIPGGFFVGYVISDSSARPEENPFLLIALFAAMMPAVLVGTYFWLRYSMIYFIANDNPEIGVLDAMKQSCEMMDGHKVRLCILSLTFTGWHILGFLALGIGMLWSTVYMLAAFAAFYDDLRQRESN